MGTSKPDVMSVNVFRPLEEQQRRVARREDLWQCREFARLPCPSPCTRPRSATAIGMSFPRGLGIRAPRTPRRGQQRSAPLRMMRGPAPTRRRLPFSTTRSAPQARAFSGATTPKVAGLWLIQACSVATISNPHPFGAWSPRPASRLIEFHPGRFTGAPRRGKRHEKRCCGVRHTAGTVTSAVRSGHRRGPLHVEKLLTAALRVVGFAATPQPEQPFRDQQVDHGGHIDAEGDQAGHRDALGQVMQL